MSSSSISSSNLSLSSNKNTNVAMRDLVAPSPPEDLHPVFDNKDPTGRGGVLLQTPTRLNYVSPDTVKGVVERDPSGYDSEVKGVEWLQETVWIDNGRVHQCKLHNNGFQLVESNEKSRCWLSKDINFLSKDVVLDRYYPHCEQLLKEQLMEGDAHDGGRVLLVKAFDHNVRQQIPAPNMMKPLGVVHGDYTAKSGPRRLQLLAEPPKINDVWRERLGETPLLDPNLVDECLTQKRRFALINVWRNIDPELPIQSFPLACMDAKSYSRDDLRVLELHYEDRVGENFLVTPPPPPAAASDGSSSRRHRWFYFPEMTFQEALLIKQWDSAGDLATGKNRDEKISTMSIHSAFMDPCTASEGTPPRQSIEVRCVVIWNEVET